MTDPHLPHRRGFLASLRASFLTGLVVVLPIGLTIYFVWAVIGWIDGWILPLIPAYYQPDMLIGRWFGPEYEFPVRGIGVLAFLIATIIVGWLAKGLIGRSIIRSGEDLVDRMPVVRSVYGGIKQVAETFFNKKEKSWSNSPAPVPGRLASCRPGPRANSPTASPPLALTCRRFSWALPPSPAGCFFSCRPRIW